MEPDNLRDGGDQYSSFAPTVFLAGKPGQNLTVQMKVVSAHGFNDPGQILVYFYLSTDTSITKADRYIGQAGANLSAGAEALLTLNTTFPTNLPEGLYYVGWIIDPDSQFTSDNNLADNIAYKSTPLRVVRESLPTVYVDARAQGTNTGSSWRNAFTNLQDALATAVPGREIRVARGVYTPDQGVGITRGNREATFALCDAIVVRGGYAGVGAADPNARDLQANATILSGDLQTDDATVADPCNLWKEPTRADNSRHVLTARHLAQMTTLDGFQIVGGYAFGPATTALADDLRGAGLLMAGGNLTLRNCTFSGNWASGDGGAIYLNAGHLELDTCTFRANGAGQAHGTGGALRNDGTSQLNLASCKFYRNFAGSQGGALDNDKGTVALTRCTFLQNHAVNAGGGALWNSTGTLTAVNCILHGNRSEYSGGAISNSAGGSLSAVNCCLHANSSKVQAAALDNFFGGKVTLSNCTLADNQAGSGAGAINCGPALDQNNSELTVANSILWDGGNEILVQGKSLVTVTYTDVQGGWADTGNLNADPGFVQPAGQDGVAGTEDDNLWLSLGSPCIDRGSNNLLPADFADLDADKDTKEPLPLDLKETPRVTGSAVDMGAYEGTSTSCH